MRDVSQGHPRSGPRPRLRPCRLDRQLAAICAGGLLRDIAANHGAIRLDELVRFTDPSEGEASLALRDADRAALGFHLDNDRVLVGDVASCLDDVFGAWSRERAGERDCLMLAPTRELVRELNLRAQASRGVVGGSVGLADGCSAHRGDVVISRRNDRRLGVSGTDWVKNGDRWMLYTMLTRGRVENHAHIGLTDEPSHALPSPTAERAMTATEVLEGILAHDGAAVSATSTQARATSPAAQLQDAVARDADEVALATSQMRANPDFAEPGPLPWLTGIPSEVVSHSAWAPYLAARSRRVSSLAAEVAADPVLPEWTAKYDDVLTAELRHELAVWRAATGVPVDERTLAGPLPHDDREAAYHRSLTSRINARYGEAVKTWADRVVEYVGRRDEQTGEFAKYLDTLAPKGIDAARMLDLAAARKPLPVDHPTAALGYRVKDLVTPRKRRPAASIDPFPRPSQQHGGPSLGM